MNLCKSVIVSFTLSLALGVFGSGMALYEPSAVSQALGGALVGRGVDASANVNNPATLIDLARPELSLGFVTEHPRARARVNGDVSHGMDPGAFILPNMSFATPLPWGFAFGFGVGEEYGLGSKYRENWEMNWSSVETTIKGVVFNPNLAYAITDRWSVGAGIRLIYFDFEQESHPLAASDGHVLGTFNNRLKGDNNMLDWGWQVGTRYRVTDFFSVGAVYKSKIDVKVKGHAMTGVGSVANEYLLDAVGRAARANNGPAVCEMELPQSVAFGFNWDIVDTFRIGAAASWTDWSSLGTLKFELPSGDRDVHLGWNDTWRFSIAPAWDFAEDWTLMGSYVYDMDCSGKQDSTMLPPADRHILSAGLSWRCLDNLEVSFCYGIVLMDGKSMSTTDAAGNRYHMSVHRGVSHAVGLSLTYRF